MSESRTETLADIVAIVGLTAIALFAMRSGLSETIVSTCAYAIVGLGGYKMSRRGKARE